MRDLLPLLPKPSRYIGTEEGAIHKDFQDISLRVGLAFPDMYEVGMSYLGLKILYAIINERESWQAERVFSPCREAAAILREHHTPLCTLEHDRPLADLDVLGFSVTHELCYTNVLQMLDLAGIPLRAAERARGRRNGGRWPLVVAGGGCTLAAEPLAPFVDLMLLGEAEAAFPEMLTVFERERDAGAGREEMLRALAGVPGVYVPEFFLSGAGGALTPRFPELPRPSRRIVPDMNDAPYPRAQPIPFGAVHNRLSLEIARGCTRGCRFCQAGSLYRPARERGVPQLRALLDDCLTGTGFDDVSFLSLSAGDFSALKELFLGAAERCAAEQISLSLPSLRVGSIDDAIMERMAGIRRTGATLAPEAGSQRLRDVINKGVSEEELILHVQKLFEHGWQQVKLYFMIGLPTETDEDLAAIVDLCRKARDAAGPGIKRLQITCAVSPFVPKPHTPFEREPQIPLPEIRRRIDFLLQAVKREKRIAMRWHEPEMSMLEGVFSRGDRRLADVVEAAFRKGALFANWAEGFSLAPWLEALAAHGLRAEDYTRGRDADELLPWEHMESGLDPAFLRRERERALRGAVTPDCRYGACRECGVCDTKAGPSRLTPLPGTGCYRNSLNRPERDQEAHGVALDEHGRVVPRGQAPGKPESNQARAKPPQRDPRLAHKAMHLLLRYSRKGPAAFLSQLELQRVFDRALRRAAMPMSFSQGFHPLPLLSFGRALPVGVASEDEWFSVHLRERRTPRDCLEALNAALPKGLRITSAELLPPGKKPVDAVRERYRLEFLGPKERRGDFAAAVGRIAASGHLPWLREGKKGTRQLDARLFFADIACAEDHCTFLFDWSENYVSPLALCLHALAACAFDTALPDIRLTKLPESAR